MHGLRRVNKGWEDVRSTVSSLRALAEKEGTVNWMRDINDVRETSLSSLSEVLCAQKTPGVPGKGVRQDWCHLYYFVVGFSGNGLLCTSERTSSAAPCCCKGELPGLFAVILFSTFVRIFFFRQNPPLFVLSFFLILFLPCCYGMGSEASGPAEEHAFQAGSFHYKA